MEEIKTSFGIGKLLSLNRNKFKVGNTVAPLSVY